MLRFEVLFPAGGGPATAETLLEATAPWERAPGDRPLVLANMVATLDGRVALDGGSTALGGPGDKAMFHALRGVVDGVLAGTGTLRAERYGRLVASPQRRSARESLGLEADPALLVITRSGEVPWEAPLFAEPAQRVGIAGPVAVPAHVRARVKVVEPAEPAAALRALAEVLGLRTVLCEGGPTLNRGLLDAGLIDELFLTLDPRLVGGEGLRVIGGGAFPAPARARLEWVLRAGDELLLRYSM